MSEAVIPGEWSDEKPVTLDVIQICLQLGACIQEMVTISPGVFIPVSFISQTVTDYVVKVYVGEDACAHLTISQPVGGELTVKDAQFPKNFNDLLIPPKL